MPTDPKFEGNMVTFKRRGVRFKHRVGAIILDSHERILLVYSPDGFWFIPGGHVELMESSQETVRREMEEELGFVSESERLLWVIEDFYHYQDDVHEIAMYYLLRPPDDCDLLDGRDTITLNEEGLEFEAGWHPLDTLDGVDLRPSCLIGLLHDIPDTPRHVVFQEGGLKEK